MPLEIGSESWVRFAFRRRVARDSTFRFEPTTSFRYDNPMKLLKILSKPAAWASGWSSAVLCFSAATGYWLAAERGRAICWVVLGAVEVAAIVW
jgi:hypothetical protein